MLGFVRGGAWRRRGASAVARQRWGRGREKGRGGSDDVFTKSALSFYVIFYRSFLLRSCGLRVRFSVLGGTFLQNRHGRVVLAVGSPTDGSDGGHCSYC